MNTAPAGRDNHITRKELPSAKGALWLFVGSGASTWQIYWFERNLQGDVVAVYDYQGTKLLSYKYDAWGNFTTTNHQSTIPAPVSNNPFRYRGYYYDKDLNLYYLNARYYDQGTRRFVSGDDSLFHSLLGYNLFVYCNNNPINYNDFEGQNAIALSSVWTSVFVPIALLEPTPVAEVILLLGIAVVSGICLANSLIEKLDIIKNGITIRSEQNTIINDPIMDDLNASQRDIRDKEEVDPYRRPGQKKQGDSLKNKSRLKDSFKDRSNKRNGRDKPKKHTPGKDHKKYFDLEQKIKIF